jgi:hypothetical protein
MNIRRGALPALKRLAALERDEARIRSAAASEQLEKVREQESRMESDLAAVRDRVSLSLRVGERIDPVRQQQALTYLMHEQVALRGVKREVLRAKTQEERARRELGARQSRVKALQKVIEHGDRAAAGDVRRLAQRELDRDAAGVGQALREQRPVLNSSQKRQGGG